jgi:hypothetical protein
MLARLAPSDSPDDVGAVDGAPDVTTDSKHD